MDIQRFAKRAGALVKILGLCISRVTHGWVRLFSQSNRAVLENGKNASSGGLGDW